MRWPSALTQIRARSAAKLTISELRNCEVRRLGDVKLLIKKKEGGEPSVRYIVSNKIDVPVSHLIAYSSMR